MYEVTEWKLREGDRLPRSNVHDIYGGNRQRGIAPSRKSPNVLLFSYPGKDEEHGYSDDLSGNVIEYFGEGQRGDQEMTHGNKAILRHREDGRALRLFQGEGPFVEYLGEYELDDEEPFRWEDAIQTGGGPVRKGIVFRLRRV